jgi:hypothetical protein
MRRVDHSHAPGVLPRREPRNRRQKPAELPFERSQLMPQICSGMLSRLTDRLQPARTPHRLIDRLRWFWGHRGSVYSAATLGRRIALVAQAGALRSKREA